MKNDIVRINITDVTPEGFGVGRIDGKVVFVADTAVGDEIDARILKETKSHSFAKIENLISPSENRIASICPVSSKCGGCGFQHISYDAELELKRNFVKQAFARIGGIEIKVNETVSDSPEGYRNKVQYPFGRGEGGKCVFGYYARNSHRIVRHEKCALQEDKFTEIASFCAETAEKLFIKAYDEESARGVLRHIVMRKNRKGEFSVCLVVAERHKKLDILAEKLQAGFPQIIGIHINVNKRRDNVIFGNETYCVLGQDTLRDELCGKIFEISPRAFYQVNAEMAEKLYNHAKALAHNEKENNIILDLYCGAGTIGLCLANEKDRLCGVEIIADAVENAKKNAILNGRTEENTLFVCGDASLGVTECKKAFGTPDVIIVDPPRKGLDRSVIETVVNSGCKRVVYISCDPATLARDCGIFAQMGFVTNEATPFDLFPRTGHVETVVCLNKQ